jgi:hypothetical protein
VRVKWLIDVDVGVFWIGVGELAGGFGVVLALPVECSSVGPMTASSAQAIAWDRPRRWRAAESVGVGLR